MSRLSKTLVFLMGLAICVPVATHLLFISDAHISFLEATWTSGEFLGYVGSILGAAATIIALIATLKKTDEDRQEEARLSILPCISVMNLTPKNRKSVFRDYTISAYEPLKFPEQEPREYAEVELHEDYAIFDEDNLAFSYQDELTEGQDERRQSYSLSMTDPNGLKLELPNPILYFPLHFKNVGNGAAVNCILSVVKADSVEKIDFYGLKGTSIQQMQVGDIRYLGIYFGDKNRPECLGKYQLVIQYEDTLGHKYVQWCSFEVIKDHRQYGASFNFVVNREYRDHFKSNNMACLEKGPRQ